MTSTVLGRKLMAMVILFACAAFARADGVPVTDGLILDLDASDASSLTLDGDVVKEWRSQVAGAPSLKAGKIVYPNAKFAVDDVHYVTEQGNKGLYFSRNGEKSLMSFGDNVQVTGKTFFFVTRQIDEKGNYGVIMSGRPTSYFGRLMRDRDTSCKWYDQNYSTLYINGVRSSDRTFSAAGGTSRPHVVAAQNGDGQSIELIGSSYVMVNDTEVNAQASTYYDKCIIFEVLIYNTVLTGQQIADVSQYLFDKWAVSATWTGAAENGDWNDAGNWENGRSPTEGMIAEFGKSASIALAGDILCGEIVNTSANPISLTFSNDVDVAVNAAISGKIDLVKEGTGTLSLAAGQTYEGTTTVVAGKLAASGRLANTADPDYGAIPGFVAHLDASRAETLVTNAKGEVTEWKSATADGPDFSGANEAYPDGRVDGMAAGKAFAHGNPLKYTDAAGRAAVRFGYDATGSAAGTFIAKSDKTPVGARTFFFVQTQHERQTDTGLLGLIVGYDFRLLRTYNKGSQPLWDYAWANNSLAPMNESWQNGRKPTGNADRAFERSGTAFPNLLVVRNNAAKNFDIIGGHYLYDKGGTVNGNVFMKMDLHEVVLFDTALTDDQIREISAALMAKWGVPSQDAAICDVGLSPNSDYVVEDGAELDLGTAVQSVKSVSGAGTATLSGLVTLGGSSSADSALQLTLNGLVDLNGATLAASSVAGAGTVTDTAASGVLKVTSDDDQVLAVDITGGAGFEKAGSGRMEMHGIQTYSGATKVTGGTLAVPQEVVDYGSIPGLVTHLDASRADTLVTNDKGEVTEWKSATAGGTTFAGANEEFPEGRVDEMLAGQSFPHGNPIVYTDGAGRAAVRFSLDANGTATAGSFITPKDKAQVSGRTFFFVQTQKAKSTGTGLLGRLGGYTFRLCRTASADCAWYSGGTIIMDESWQNGRKGGTTVSPAGDAGRTFEKSGTELPNLLVVRNEAVRVFEVIGGQYLYDTSSKTANGGVCCQMDLHEVLVFDTALTDDQITEISAQLMDKWGVPRQADVYLPDMVPQQSDIEIAAGATYDPGCHAQTLKSVGGSGSLVVGGAFAVSDASSAAGALAIEGSATVDLAGGSLAVSGWTGVAKVVNSSATTGRLIFDTDVTRTFACTIDGDISVEKRGSGTVLLPPGQNATGATTLGGGELRTEISSRLARYGHVALHVDASCPETLTLAANGDVIRWDSPEGEGRFLNNAHDAYPDAKFRTAYSHFVTDAMGRPCVRFSYNEDNVHTGAVMAISSELTAQTLFFVNRQRDAANTGLIIGDRYSYDDRIHRINTAGTGMPEECGWRIQPIAQAGGSWLHGDHWISCKRTAEFSSSSGTEGPHVLAARCARPTTFELIGAGYLHDGGPDKEIINYAAVYSNADIYEVVAYEESLTEAQIKEISALLVAKWAVKTATDVTVDKPRTIAEGTDVVVTAPTALGLWGAEWVFESLTFDVGGAETCPALSLVGCCDVTETPLAFKDAENVGRGKFLLTTGALTSPFASVSGLDAGSRVTYRPSCAKISNGGGVIFVR